MQQRVFMVVLLLHYRCYSCIYRIFMSLLYSSIAQWDDLCLFKGVVVLSQQNRVFCAAADGLPVGLEKLEAVGSLQMNCDCLFFCSCQYVYTQLSCVIFQIMAHFFWGHISLFTSCLI